MNLEDNFARKCTIDRRLKYMSQENNNVEPKWYVVHTYSGYENKVKTDLEKTIKNRELEDYFFDIVVPMEEQIEIKDGKRKTNLKKVFPGYVLVKMIVTEESWYIVMNVKPKFAITHAPGYMLVLDVKNVDLKE